MSSFFKSSIIPSIFLIMLGGLLVFESEATIVTISYLIGGVLIGLGALSLIKYASSKTQGQLDIIYGIVTAVLGVLIIIHPRALASLLPIALGICIVISSASKLQYSLELKNEKNDLWKTTFIIGLISTICGVVLIFNPFKGATMLMQVVGIFIIIYAVLDMISTMTIRKNVNTIKKEIKTITDAVIVEENEEPKKKTKK